VVTRALADTSVFVAQEIGRPLQPIEFPEIAVSVITIGELRAGVLAAGDVPTRDRRLQTLDRALALEPVQVDERVAGAWARLRVDLREARRSMPVNDSWIAATAIALGVPVLSQDDDYEAVPGLTAIRV
jgi:predicted nucleic acid-binding protein